MKNNSNYCISIDWLSIYGIIGGDVFVSQEKGGYRVSLLGHGSKIWKKLFRVEVLEDSGTWRPFGSVGVDPWFERTEGGLKTGGLSGDSFLLKLDNSLLYECDWFALTVNFLNTFHLIYKSVSRCDIAADFCLLKNHVTGKKIVRMIKTLNWWKAGQNKVVEVYRLPYHFKKICRGGVDDGWSADSKQWLTENPEDSLTESLTFGTHSSICQVQLYDKSKELERSEIDGICGKQYIKERWEESGILRDGLHVWRLEFRLSSKAECITPRGVGIDITRGWVSVDRKLTLWDLDKDNLWYTFQCVQNSWFVLLDATQGGKVSTIDAEYMRKMRTHKSRLPRISLFDDYSEMKFRTKKYQPNPTRFVKVLMNGLKSRAASIRLGDIPGSEEDAEKLMKAFESLRDIYLSRTMIAYSNEYAQSWAYLSEVDRWEDAEDAEFEDNLQLDLFYDQM